MSSAMNAKPVREPSVRRRLMNMMLLTSAAGFSLGLERLLAAVNGTSTYVAAADPLVVSVDDEAARRLRSAGFRVVRAVTADEAAAEREARASGAAYLVTANGPLYLGEREDAGGAPAAIEARLRAALTGSR